MSSLPTPAGEPAMSQPEVATPPPSVRPRRPSDLSGRLLPGLILIVIGLVFLISNFSLIPLGGGALVIGLGLAFLLGRLLSGQYGLAVPAGILLGFGTFVTLEEARLLPGDAGGWFFILLGLGFLAVYLIGARPAAIWPFFPAVALIGFGTLIQGVINAALLAPYAPLAAYWPVVLVVLGLWLLVRDRLPAALRGPLGTIGGLLLAAYGLLAIAVGIAGAVEPAAFGWARPTVGWPGIGRAGTPFSETADLASPIGATDTLRVNNSSGRTVVRAGSGSEVRVMATKRGWAQDRLPEVRLTPAGDSVRLESTDGGGPLRTGWVDYEIEVPAGARLELNSSSGDVSVAGHGGSIQVNSSSGDVVIDEASGPIVVRTSSGDIRLTGTTGEVTVATSSGDVRATGLARLREASTSSGRLTLEGIFTDAASIRASSGDVTLRFAPESAVRIEATTTSGDIRAAGLALTGQQQERRRLTGALGAGGTTLRVGTTSGDISLTNR